MVARKAPAKRAPRKRAAPDPAPAPEPKAIVLQLEAVDAAVEELGDRIKPADVVLVELCRGIARDIDAPYQPNENGLVVITGRAALWREYRAAVAQLLALGAEDKADDGQTTLAAALSTAVRDQKNPKPSDARAGARGGKRGAGNAAHAVAASGRRRRGGAAS